MSGTTPLDDYTRTCDDAAAVVISAYSTSFSAAVRLLGARHRGHIRNVYALVRVADELVDGVGQEAGLDAAAQADELRELERRTYRAMELGYSSDAIVHAFAVTARECGIERAIVEPFFASMRTDIAAGVEAAAAAREGEDARSPGATEPPHDVDGRATDHHDHDGARSFTREEHASYVYGSAQVVGLMCLRVFTREEHLGEEERHRLEEGARSLGAAFQNINFLRDLADDADRLRRDYLGAHERLTDADRAAWLVEIAGQLAAARRALPLLPRDARRAVRSALDLFAELTDRLARVPAAELYERRVRVPDAVKLAVLARASARTMRERT